MPFDSTAGSYDFNFLPPNFNGDVQAFFTNNNGQGTHKWIKPRGVTMCMMICIGGGGGGGGGTTGASTTARGGGGGGACSSVAKMITPAMFLPDALLVQVAIGGKGAAAGGIGTSGSKSFISYGVGLTALSTIPNVILQSDNQAASGGAAGTNATGGAGGSAPTISTAALQGAATSWGEPAFIVGLVGGVGGAQTGAVGTTVTAGWNLICTIPGAGGAGVNTVSTGFAGGGITIQAAFDFSDGAISPAASIIAGGAAGSASAAGNGNAGIQLWKPFYMSGGSGGGSSDGSTGGSGGNGGIGCGGGGGGGGTTGGTGGNGGDGAIIIISW